MVGTLEHPATSTVRRRFKTWKRAPAAPSLDRHPARQKWDDAEMIKRLQQWTTDDGRPPRSSEWIRGTPRRTAVKTLRQLARRATAAGVAARAPERL